MKIMVDTNAPFQRVNFRNFKGTVKNNSVQSQGKMPECDLSAQNYAAIFCPNLNQKKSEINFTGNKRIGRKNFVFAQYQDKISCPCCGEKMHTFDETKARELSRNIAGKKGDELSSVLRKNMDEFQASKRGLVYEIAELAPYYPDYNISEILGKISDEYTDTLRKKQICIMMDLVNEIPNLHPKDKIVINDWRYQQIKRIMEAKDEGDFRNKLLVTSFIKEMAKEGVEIDEERIRRYFDKLPNSKKDTDAFVIKYMRRSPKETAFCLIKNVEPTIEHIVPFSESKNNHPSNLMVMCSDCNSARGSIPYRDFLVQRPEMMENVEKYFEDIDAILTDKMRASKSTRKRYKNYVQGVSHTLNDYTEGVIEPK